MRYVPTILAFVLGVAACSRARREVTEGSPAVPSRPAGCRDVAHGSDLAAVLASAQDGDSLCLAPGRWTAPIDIAKRISIWGPRDAVIAANRPGSVVTITGAGAALAGLTIDGSSSRFDKLDAAVHVLADDVRVEGIAVVHSVYGILVEKCKRATVIDNHVRGDAATAMGMRGDTIRLWETYDSVVRRNLVEDGRDMVVWYSSRNIIAENRVLRGRYGTHFMYSHDNDVHDNAYVDGVVGVFVMYSKRVTLTRNLVINASGASGMAIGLKDAGDIVVRDNVLVHDTVGIYLDNTPGQADESLTVEGNAIRMCTTAIHMHSTPYSARFAGNSLADNGVQLAAEAGTRPTQATWRGNYFDDYAGYDLDDDGVGDLPHAVESASEDLVAQHAELAFFRGGPALALVDIGSRLLPLWEPRVLLVDAAPRMNAPPLPELRTVTASSGIRPPEVQHAD